MALTGDRLTRILNTYDTALQGAEDATLQRIYAALDGAGKLLEQKLIKSYAKNQGVQGLLPNDRALLIRQEIAEYMALLKPEQREAIEADFERLLSTASQTGLNLSQELINATTNTNVAPFAVANLEAVRFQAQDAASRLYRWTDEYQRKISGIVEMHLAVGSGPQKVAATLRSELGIAKGRAEAIARTESISAMDSATRENYKRADINLIQRVATQDIRCCPYCAARAGKVYRVEEAPAAIHPRCLTPGTLVSGAGVVAGTERKYLGDVITIQTASGNKLTVTPNHPILTPQGWVDAGSLKDGDSVLSCLDGERVTRAIAPDKYNRPSLIEEVFAALRESSGVSARSVEVAPEDFHGDGEGSKVCVVAPNLLLGDRLDPQPFNHGLELDLLQRLTEFSFLTNGGKPLNELIRNIASPVQFACPCGSGFPLLRGHELPFQGLGLGLVSDMNSVANKNAADSSTVYPELLGASILGQPSLVAGDHIRDYVSPSLIAGLALPSSPDQLGLGVIPTQPTVSDDFSEYMAVNPSLVGSVLNRFPGQIQLDRITKISRDFFEGHVYNLETQTGWYFANNILTHNCRCFNSPYRPEWAALGLIDNAWMEKHAADVRSQVEARGEKINDGPAPFERMNGLQPPKPVWSPGEPLPVLGKQKQSPANLESLMRTGRDRIQKLGDKPTTQQFKAIRDELLKGLPAKAATKLAQKSGITVSAQSAADATGITERLKGGIVATVAEFHQLTGGNVKQDLGFVRTDNRAWADVEERVINVGEEPSREGIFHELGHFLEADNPGLAEAARQWRDAKATGEARPLNELLGSDSYTGEKAVPGSFIKPYVGKVYNNDLTEVVSVGMEHMVSPERMKELFEADPDHFAFMIGALEAAKAQRLKASQGQAAPKQTGEKLYMDWYDKFLGRTPEDVAAIEAKRRAEFQDYLDREAESIRRRTSGEIDRKLREYYDAEARQIRQKLGIPEPEGAIASDASDTPDDLQIKSYNRNLKPVPVPGLDLDIDEASLSDSGKAALKVARDYQQVLSEINEAIAKIPGPDKTLPADAYQRIYSNINGLFDRVTGLVNESKVLAGKTGNEALDAQLARMSKISKEALPGYEIKPITPELETKAAKRPC